LRGEVADERLHGERNEVGGVARLGRALAQLRQDRHGDLGEVVEDEVVNVALLDELARRRRRVAPVARGAADADGLAGHENFLLSDWRAERTVKVLAFPRQRGVFRGKAGLYGEAQGCTGKRRGPRGSTRALHQNPSWRAARSRMISSAPPPMAL